MHVVSRIDSRSEQVFTLSNGSGVGFVSFWNTKNMTAAIVHATSVFVKRAVVMLFGDDMA